MRSFILCLSLALLLAPCSLLHAQTAIVYKTIASDALLENLAIKSGKSITVLSGGAITINSGATITNNGTATGFGGGTIATLTDVTLTSLAGLDLLMYDSGTSKWINVAPATARSYLDLDGTIEGGLSFTGTNGAALNIGDGGTLKSGAFSEYGTDENQLLRWATNANANPVTYAIGATDLGAVKRIASLPIAAGGTNAETANAALNNLLPSQTTHAGEFLWTDGVDTNWGLVDLGSSVQGLLPASSLSTGTVPSDNTITFGPGATSAGLNVGSNNADPATLNNGDLWYESSANALRARINGTTRDLLHSGSSIDSSQITDGTIVNADISGSAAIALSKLAQSGATSNQVISWNGSAWAPATTSTGITIGTTTTSGASANDILISNGTVVQKITPGTGVATALGNAVDAASGLLTYSLIGTSGTKLPLLNTANTWSAAQTNSTASAASTPAMLYSGAFFTGGSGTTTFPHVLIQPSGATASTSWNTGGTALGINADVGTGNLLDAKYDGTTKFRLPTTGGFEADIDGSNKFSAVPYSIFGLSLANGMAGSPRIALNTQGPACITLASDGGIVWTNSDATYHIYGSAYTGPSLYADAQNVLAQRNSTYAQELRVYGTYTDASNYVRASIAATSTSVTIQPQTAGTGADNIDLTISGVGTGGVKVGGGTAISKIKHGTATLSSGAATVSDSDVVAGSRIIVHRQADGGTVGDSFSLSISAGSQFTITSMTAGSTAFSDTSTVSWIMVNP